ncbi:MAG: tetratricopeptide repeat protein [Rhodocyclaceae bacterium]|nr:tetratricopeptide repeat protein [Rhodocyclaceae bacterium]
MTEAERFQKVRELFDATAELPAAERPENLRRLTDDESIVAEVLALCLGNDEDSTTHFSKPLSSALQSATAPALKAGDKLGVWQVGREIGHGGMGSVYMVERVDGHFTQTAALKFIKGLPRSETLKYFSRERQLLAKLTHPNIARLLDGGATTQGQPYLVMEYIDGIAIDIHCHRQRLTTTQILKLFAVACDAVAFSHRQLIVHCDLKPSNILINQEGRPILLDFGIARLLDRVGTQADDAAIGSSAAYTPRYASPEQREHGTVTTVSDIYSLGVMLGELLGDAVAADIELKALLAKATAADPAQRYATVEAFTADIERYRQKLPLSALPAATGYIARKFIERRWPLVLVGAAFAATVVGFTIKVVVEIERATAAEKTALTERDRAQLAEAEAIRERDATQRARAEAVVERDAAARERDRATSAESAAASERNSARRAEAVAIRERDRATQAERQARDDQARANQAEAGARQTSEFLVSIFDSSNPNADSGDIPTSRLIAAAESRLAAELSAQPGVQAELYSALARVQANMGNTLKANENFQRALEFERKQNRPLELAQILNRVANLRGANFGVAQAEPFAREALQLRERYAAPNSDALAESLATLGGILTSRGRREEALQLLRRSQQIREQNDPNSNGMATSLHLLALHSVRYEQYEKALGEFERSMAIRSALVGQGHPDYLASLEEYANTLNSMRRYADAEAAIRRAIEARRKLHGHRNEKVAFGLNVLGNIVTRQGRSREAISIFREALSIVEAQFGKRSMPYASVVNNLAIPLQNVGDLVGADQAYTEAMTTFASIWPDTDLTLARTRFNVARIRLQMGKLEGVEDLLNRSYTTRQKALGDNHGEVIETALLVAEWRLANGDLKGARAMFDQIAPSMPVKDVFTEINFERLAARIAIKQGERSEILQRLDAVESKIAKAFGEASPRFRIARAERAEWLATTGDAADRSAARDLARSLLSHLNEQLDPNAPVLARLRALTTP